MAHAHLLAEGEVQVDVNHIAKFWRNWVSKERESGTVDVAGGLFPARVLVRLAVEDFGEQRSPDV